MSSALTAATLSDNSSATSSALNVIARTLAPFNNLFTSFGAIRFQHPSGSFKDRWRGCVVRQTSQPTGLVGRCVLHSGATRNRRVQLRAPNYRGLRENRTFADQDTFAKQIRRSVSRNCFKTICSDSKLMLIIAQSGAIIVGTLQATRYCLPHRHSTMVNQIALLINRCLAAIFADKRLPSIREHWFLRHEKIH